MKYNKFKRKRFIKRCILKEQRKRQNIPPITKKAFIKSRNASCEVCGGNKNLNVHHERYVQDQKYWVLLCKSCHNKRHTKLNKDLEYQAHVKSLVTNPSDFLKKQKRYFFKIW